MSTEALLPRRHTGAQAFQRVSVLIRASRVAGWPFGPILYGIGIINSESAIPSVWRAALQTVSLSFPLCIIVFGVNDVYDYDSDMRNPRKHAAGLEGSILDPAYHRDVLAVACLSSVALIVISVLSGQPQNIVAVAALVLLGWQYSAPPLRLKEVPVADSLSNGCIVFLAWFVGFSFSGRSIAEALGAKGLVLGLCTMGVHALGAVVDRDADAAAGQKTIAVVLGKRPSAIFAAAC
ncbi:hypothetical protein PLICRDRAFT_32559 [Plicaturopsis crispa FD-325 SS-3]|uniref:Unplaced genomic scaffold PLICRscaffold_19, whole genome shotgun sequence n=1 Tax=Plicaturopsis crispa FD-325 SS-3 TaxID=944288 RepID=A0A0C9T4C4_PLICR|nr:hypothetical protein PLICRDRAFT_32559 [Plicaturopsis crispa FD-325 SS-3]